MSELIIIIAVLGGVIGLFALIAYLKKRGILKEGFLKDINEAVNIAKLFTDVLPLDMPTKNKTEFIFDIVEDVTEYIHYLEDNNVNKNQLSYDTVLEILNRLAVTPTDSQKKLALLAIESSLKHLENTQKRHTKQGE
ncbi:hypothetical protein D3C74_344240 [compost metagenome]